MSLSAVLTAHNIQVIDWSKTKLDNVLLQGDKMYVKTLNSGLIVLDPGVQFLSVDTVTYQKLLAFHVVATSFLTKLNCPWTWW